MQIEILFFGITADISNQKSIFLEIAENISVLKLRTILADKFPRLNDYKTYSVAVNMEYTDDISILKKGDIVALIPPVSGG